MGNLIEVATWSAGIPYFEADAILTGGPDCPDNIPIQALANRTAFLKKQIDDAVSGALTVMYANRLKTARTISMSGDGTWSVSFDGNGNVTAAMTLANSGVAAGTYRSVTVDGKGRVIAATNPTTLAGYGITDALLASSYTAADVLTKLKTVDGAASGLDADLLDGQEGGYYLAWGNQTGKPTTLAGYGITDASVANLTDTTITAPAAGHLLRWNGAKWVNVALVAADIPALDWSKLASGKPTTLAGYGITDALLASSYTAADVLAKLKTVDGAASGLDADMLDGQQSSYYLAWGNQTGKPNTLAGYGITDAVFQKVYESAVQAITSGGLLTLAHGLAATPRLIGVNLVCVAADQGYDVNDNLEWVFIDANNNVGRGVSIVKDSANLTIRYGSDANVFLGVHKSTGNSVILNNSSWKAVFRAYA